MDKNQLLYITVSNPNGTQFQGHAQAVTSYNHTGVFDVLAYHTNFISIINNSLIIHQDPQKPVTIPVETGIMKVYENTVTVFIGITNLS